MTGREAIDLLKREHAKITDVEPTNIYGISLKAIINDLEILEILKPMLRIRKGNNWERLVVIDGFFNTKEQKTKVKEWLENDK
jgi:hypothetical protein